MTEKNKHIEDKTIRHYGEEALREEAEAILDQIALLDDNFEKAVDLMYHCEGKIIVTGVGKSGHVGARSLPPWHRQELLPSTLIHSTFITATWV